MTQFPQIQAAIALGSNLGDRHWYLQQAIASLQSLGRVRACSFVYETQPWGPSALPYYNQVILLETSSDPETLLTQLQLIESSFGRVREERWGARTLDLDILLFSDHCVSLPHLIIPHKELFVRPFVLAPLCDIAPNTIIPGSTLTVEEAWQQLPEQSRAQVVRLHIKNDPP